MVVVAVVVVVMVVDCRDSGGGVIVVVVIVAVVIVAVIVVIIVGVGWDIPSHRHQRFRRMVSIRTHPLTMVTVTGVYVVNNVRRFFTIPNEQKARFPFRGRRRSTSHIVSIHHPPHPHPHLLLPLLLTSTFVILVLVVDVVS